MQALHYSDLKQVQVMNFSAVFFFWNFKQGSILIPYIHSRKSFVDDKCLRYSCILCSLCADVDTFLKTATEQLIEGQSFDNIYNYLGNLREKGGGQRNNLWTAAGAYCSTEIQTSCEVQITEYHCFTLKMFSAFYYIDVHTEAGHMKQGKDIVQSRLHLGELKDDIKIP